MKAVIFDFNGTLFFDNDKHIKAWGAISKKLRGCDITEEELATRLNGVPNKEIIQYFMNNQATLKDINTYSLLKEEYYRQFCREDQPNFHLVAGATSFFDKLKRHHIPFTIASASIKENIDFFVESFELFKWFKPNEIVYDDGTYQNKIAMFKKAAEILQVPIQDVAVFEDSFSGVANAYQAGCRHIVVICPQNQAPLYEKLDGVVKTISDFEDKYLDLELT